MKPHAHIAPTQQPSRARCLGVRFGSASLRVTHYLRFIGLAAAGLSVALAVLSAVPAAAQTDPIILRVGPGLTEIASPDVRGYFQVRLGFGRDVTGFARDDVELTGGTITAFETAISYSWLVTVDVDAAVGETVTVAVRANAIEGGNSRGEKVFDVGGAGLTADISSDASEPVSGDFDVTVTFSQPVVDDDGISNDPTGWFRAEALAVMNGRVNSYEPVSLMNRKTDTFIVTITPLRSCSGSVVVELPKWTIGLPAPNSTSFSTGNYSEEASLQISCGGNNPPTFTDGASTTRSVDENTASGQNVGTAVGATDFDNDPLTYTLGGTDASSFEIVSTSGRIQTSAALDYEAKSSYSVEVSVSDGNDGGTASIDVNIMVDDVLERPATPSAPSVVATPGSNTSLDVSWTAPGTNGGPAIIDYDVRYRGGYQRRLDQRPAGGEIDERDDHGLEPGHPGRGAGTGAGGQWRTRQQLVGLDDDGRSRSRFRSRSPHGTGVARGRRAGERWGWVCCCCWARGDACCEPAAGQ